MRACLPRPFPRPWGCHPSCLCPWGIGCAWEGPAGSRPPTCAGARSDASHLRCIQRHHADQHCKNSTSWREPGLSPAGELLWLWPHLMPFGLVRLPHRYRRFVLAWRRPCPCLCLGLSRAPFPLGQEWQESRTRDSAGSSDMIFCGPADSVHVFGARCTAQSRCAGIPGNNQGSLALCALPSCSGQHPP